MDFSTALISAYRNGRLQDSQQLLAVTVSAGKSGYGAFSVSQSVKESVFSYIAEQEIHHRRMNLQDEFRALLNKHGIRFDERYVWD